MKVNPYRQAVIGRPVSPTIRQTRDGNPMFKYDVRNDCVTLDEASRTTFDENGEVESLWNDLNGWEIRPPRTRAPKTNTSYRVTDPVALAHPLFARKPKSDSFADRARKLGIKWD